MGTASHLLMVKAKHNGYIKVELDERQMLTRLLTSLAHTKLYITKQWIFWFYVPYIQHDSWEL